MLKPADRQLWGRKGMTLVELLVAIAVTGIVMTISITVFLRQYESSRRSQGAKTTQVDSQFAIEMLKEEISLAGWGVLPKMAFYIEDGGTTGADRIYINDISVINPKSVSRMELMVDSGCASCTTMNAGNNATSYVTLGNGTNVFSGTIEPILYWTAGSGLARARTTGNTGSTNLFNATTITGQVTPAIGYCADGGDSSRCTPADTTELWTLRKFSRSTGGQMLTVASDVADLQVTYSDGTTEYCNGASTCPMATFDASKIKWIKIAVVTRSREKTRSKEDPSSCRPAVANRSAGATNSTECGYEYRTYTTTIGPLVNVAH